MQLSGPSDLTLISALVATGVGVALALALRRHTIDDRLALLALPFLVMVTAGFLGLRLLVHPVFGAWSPARLAPAAALWRGFRLYHPDGQGPVSCWLYPPMSALAYLPAALLPDPAWSVLAGRILSIVFVLGPLAWLVWPVRDRRANWIWALQLGLLIVLLVSGSRALTYVSTEILADAPALGFGALALGVIATRRTERPSWAVPLAAALAALSAWSKQLMVPLVPFVVLVSWITAARGRRRRALFEGTLAVGVVSLLIAVVFGPRELFFNLVTLPSRHPWKTDPGGVIPLVLGAAWRQHLLLFLLLALGLAGKVLSRSGPCREDELSARPRHSAWPFLAVGVIEIPLAVLGFIKVGGGHNSLAASLYFLALAAVLLLGDLLARWRRLGLAVLALNLLLGWPAFQWIHATFSEARPSWADDQTPGRSWWSEQELVVRFLRRHPGAGYFPTNPLEHLLAEGKLYHFEYGVYDRRLAGFPLSRDQLWAHVPPRAELVCYPPGWSETDFSMVKELGAFPRRLPVPELPDYACFARP